MPGCPRAAAVLYAKDIARVSAFYAAVCGLSRSQAEADHVVLDSPALQLVVVQVPPWVGEHIDITSPPQRRAETPIKIVFPVHSFAVARALADRLGGMIDPPEREWPWQDGRVCDGHDPEGNVLQLRLVIG